MSKGRDGAVEAIRALMVAKRSAKSERNQTINQARAIVLTGPDDLRTQLAGLGAAEFVAKVAALRPRQVRSSTTRREWPCASSDAEWNS
jgi:hypothetical protein